MKFARLFRRRRSSPEMAAAVARHPSTGGRHLRAVPKARPRTLSGAPRVTIRDRIRRWIIEGLFGLKDWQLLGILGLLCLPGLALLGLLVGSFILSALRP